MNFRSKKVFAIALVALVVFFVVRSIFFSRQEATKETAKVSYGTLQASLSLSGKIDADQHVTLQFQTPGKLAWVGVKEGDYVEKYQGIAALDPITVQKQLGRYLNLYMKTRWDFEQTKDTYKNDIITDTIKRILEKSQFDLNNSVLDVEIQNESVKLANLWTPIAGIVTHIDSPYAGVNVLPSQASFSVVNPESIYFSATADQTDVTKLKKGMKGTLKLDSFPNKPLEGEIAFVAFTPKDGEANTVYTIKFTFPHDNSDYRYKIGMTGDLSFVTEKKENVLFIPSKFVKSDGDKKYIIIVKNGTKMHAPVSIGLEAADAVEITSGVSSGDIVYD